MHKEVVPNDQNNNIQALIQIMAWRRPGGKFIDTYMRQSASVR